MRHLKPLWEHSSVRWLPHIQHGFVKCNLKLDNPNFFHVLSVTNAGSFVFVWYYLLPWIFILMWIKRFVSGWSGKQSWVNKVGFLWDHHEKILLMQSVVQVQELISQMWKIDRFISRLWKYNFKMFWKHYFNSVVG